jgi:hypothetical protein
MYQYAKMKRKEAEKEEDMYMCQLAACIMRLPQSNSPNLPLTANYLSAVIQQVKLISVPQKRKKDKDNDDEDEDLVPQKKKKIEKEEEEDNNEVKQKNQKHSIFFALHTQEEKKKWGILGRMEVMTPKRQVNWAKGWCDINNIPSELHYKEEGYNKDQFEEDNNKLNSIFNKSSSSPSSSSFSSSSSSPSSVSSSSPSLVFSSSPSLVSSSNSSSSDSSFSNSSSSSPSLVSSSSPSSSSSSSSSNSSSFSSDYQPTSEELQFFNDNYKQFSNNYIE